MLECVGHGESVETAIAPVGFDGVPDGYRPMAERDAIKVMVTP